MFGLTLTVCFFVAVMMIVDAREGAGSADGSNSAHGSVTTGIGFTMRRRRSSSDWFHVRPGQGLFCAAAAIDARCGSKIVQEKKAPANRWNR